MYYVFIGMDGLIKDKLWKIEIRWFIFLVLKRIGNV